MKNDTLVTIAFDNIICRTPSEKTAKCMVCRVLMQDRSFAMPKIELKLL